MRLPVSLLGLAAPVLLILTTAPSPAEAAQNGAAPAPNAPCVVPSTTYTNGTAEMTLCIQGHKIWREKRNNARTTQVHATLNNTGNSMVCDLRVEIEDMEDALRWWPDWANTTRVSIVEMRSCDGEDPPASYFEAPAKQLTNMVPPPNDKAAGSAAADSNTKKPAVAAPKPANATTAKPNAKPKAAPRPTAESEGDAEGEEAETPETAPEEDDGVAASTLKKPDCSTKTGAGGLKARWCIEKAPYVWVEPKHHRRIVRVRGEIANLESNVSLCGITVQLDSNKSAINTWPDWWPESDEDDPLDPGNSFVVGANVYYKRGAPKMHLLSFRACVDTGAVPEEPEAAAPATAAPVVNPTSSAASNSDWQQPAAQQPAPAQQSTWNNNINNNNNNNNNNWQQQGGGGGDNNNNNWGQPAAQQQQQQGNNWGQPAAQQQPAQQQQGQENNWGWGNNNKNNNNGGGNQWWQN